MPQPDPTPPIDHKFFSAPLVELVETDVKTLDQPRLEAYLKRIREMRASKATMKAKTSQTSKKSTLDLDGLL